MQDLTQGSIPRHIFSLAAPIAIGMVFQTLYILIDLYFVARLGDAAIAGVSAAGNLQLLVMALTQVLAVGSMALIAQASGRKDREDANEVFNQSLTITGLCTVATLLFGYVLAGRYMEGLGADAATAQAGVEYLYWFLPGLALQFPLNTLGAALRGTGIARPTMLVQMLTVVLNLVLAPVLIAGWLTGVPLGIAGAGIATSVAVTIGTVLMVAYFLKLERFVAFDPSMLTIRPATWGRIVKIGIPPGGELALIFLFYGLIYWIIRDFGAEAQAAFGIGVRITQALFLPVMAIAFATAPVAGQNVGAGLTDRVRHTFYVSAIGGSTLMVMVTLICQWQAPWFIDLFTEEPAVIAVGAEFLRVVSWNFFAAGLIFTASSMFQAMGNTLPGLLAGITRLITFFFPGIWLAAQPWFELRHLWFLSVATTLLQAAVATGFVLLEFRWRLPRLASGEEAAPLPAGPLATGPSPSAQSAE
jgi:putative MATE family efflux protein